ncbi:S1 RNA-binding domain-containing protein [bacterium]|nr:S1 RNA-binding domain-containing protein [bacterium]
MSEGTRIGEFKDAAEFNTAAVAERVVPSDLKPTKIGEISEFEKSLISESGAPVRNSDSTVGQDGTFAEEMERMILDYQDGDIIKGIVRRIEKSGVLVDINHKSEGFISNSEFGFEAEESPVDNVKPGEEVNVMILKLESKEGYTVLSRRRAEYELAWNTLSRLSKSKDVVPVRVASKVEGGLVVSYNGIKGFIPASQVIKETENLDGFVGQVMEVAVIQVDRKRRKVIFSHKVGKPRMSREDTARLIDGIEIGQVRNGKVTSIKDFGVFVDLGGVEGLVHISEISWSRVGHPSEVLKSGQETKVFVLGVDRDTQKISLGMKQLEADPWVNVAEKYQIGQVATGEVSRVVTFGAFVRLEENLEGLIHISELSNHHVEKVEDVVKPGDTVKVKIIKLIPEEQRIGLSIKALSQSTEAASSEASQEEVVNG